MHKGGRGGGGGVITGFYGIIINLLLTLSLKTIGPNTFRLISPDSPTTPTCTLYVNERMAYLIPSRDKYTHHILLWPYINRDFPMLDFMNSYYRGDK